MGTILISAKEARKMTEDNRINIAMKRIEEQSKRGCSSVEMKELSKTDISTLEELGYMVFPKFSNSEELIGYRIVW